MYDYYDYIAELNLYDDKIENEMHKVQDEALMRLSQVFAHFKDIKSLALTIIYGYCESHESAIKVAEQIKLSKIEILAITENFEAFKELFLEELDKAENF